MHDSAAAMNGDRDLAGLDFDFLRYMGVEPEAQRAIQRFYLPFFRNCTNVVDLGCGDGDFVKMLVEHGVPVTGVDTDDKARQAAEVHNLPFVQEDVFHFLRALPSASLDGVFCAHLVEHMPYQQVIELVRLSYEALAPGGVIVIATPDVRSLFSHLEMYYLHFGHVSFYHPRLLCFFLDHEGFVDAEYGVNPQTASPLLPDVQDLAAGSVTADVTYRRELPQQGNSLLHRASYSIKRRLAHWLVLPFVDDLNGSINREMKRTRMDLRSLAASLQTLNGPFECYAVARKPDATTSAE